LTPWDDGGAGNNARARFKFSSEGKSCLSVVNNVSNGWDGEALRRWLAPNALARTLITRPAASASLNKSRFGQFSEAVCIAQVIPFAVSSSTPWRVYA